MATTTNGDEYSQLVGAVELTELMLLDLDQHRELIVTPPLEIQIQFRVDPVTIEDTQLCGHVTFELSAKPPQSEEAQIQVSMVWRLCYSVEEEVGKRCSRETKEQFLHRNIPINIWPYIREFVTALTAKMGLSPLVLPLLRITR